MSKPSLNELGVQATGPLAIDLLPSAPSDCTRLYILLFTEVRTRQVHLLGGGRSFDRGMDHPGRAPQPTTCRPNDPATVIPPRRPDPTPLNPQRTDQRALLLIRGREHRAMNIVDALQQLNRLHTRCIQPDQH